MADRSSVSDGNRNKRMFYQVFADRMPVPYRIVCRDYRHFDLLSGDTETDMEIT